MLNDHVLAATDALRQSFQSGLPFKHLMIDDFFTPEAAEKLLEDFPAFDPVYAISESGTVGGKAVITEISGISDFYRRVHAYIASPPFLDAMSAITGIPNLLPDPGLFGAGTHDNQHGQDLLPHVDFNYDRSRTLHRRLNLLLYLNKGWEEAWGGAIQIYSDPRQGPWKAEKTINVLFNRAVMFETNEHSWHGFRVIDLPADKRHMSRKALAIYFYTTDRPAEEVAPPHGTFYWHWPLDPRFQAGRTLTTKDVADLEKAIRSRDSMLKSYQKMELSLSGQQMAQARYTQALSERIQAPVSGYALPQGQTRGLMHDNWVAGDATFSLLPEQPVMGMDICGWLPDYIDNGPEIVVRADGEVMARHKAAAGLFTVPVTFARAKTQAITIELSSSHTFSGKSAGINEDMRELAFYLVAVRLRHKKTRW